MTWFARVATGRGWSGLRARTGRITLSDRGVDFAPDDGSAPWILPVVGLQARRNGRWSATRVTLRAPGREDVRLTVSRQPMTHLQTAQTEVVIAGWTTDFLEDLDRVGVTVLR